MFSQDAAFSPGSAFAWAWVLGSDQGRETDSEKLDG